MGAQCRAAGAKGRMTCRGLLFAWANSTHKTKRNDRGRVGLQHFAASLGHDKTLRANVPEFISVWIMLDQACEFAKTQIIGHNDGQRQRLKAAFSGPRCGDYHGTLFFMLRYGAIQKNARGKGPVEM